MLDCAIASGRPVPDGRRISRLADDLADGRPAVSGPAPAICRGVEFAFPVKDNQPGLSGAPGALPWRDVPVTHAATDRGHGRIATRTIQVMDAPGDLPFPHVSQAT